MSLEHLVPSTVAVVELGDPASAEPLFPEERALVERAIERRKLEFALGRTAARRALRRIGAPATPLLPRPDRSLIWPDGAVGSITHTDGICIAVAAKTSDHAGLGIDVEREGRVRRELWRLIATDAETRWLEEGEDERAKVARATRLFSAKEAFYKAQFCVSAGWVGFHDVHLELDEHGGFELELRTSVPPFEPGHRFGGRWFERPGHVITWMALPPR
jgi:4'-phosphopantetheinyl transferase EntD